jgi:ribonuclease HI
MEKPQVYIYTDGACEPNPGPGGYGAVLQYGPKKKTLSEGFRYTTNNRMELLAAIKALETLKNSCEVFLFSDSKYLVDSITLGKVEEWKNNNWYRTKRLGL